ncbi:reverse transcriptase [Trypanosoma brucei equiperdum]|uniref:Reverse transcriptase n=1 Tax=Trypanosoma brucei equiperdum TaxID=630700 RepID=A0A3L6LFJ2_9TRYP|nr:reverse transcriptase [Trypanosoma brucei equiperdum]
MAELRRSIKLLPSGSAAGPDCLYNEALQHLGGIALNVVLRLFNESLRTGVVPSAWKTGVIIPILKAGKKAEDLDSYRPVTLTSCLCKVMERIIAARLRDTFESQLTPQESGFRPGCSTLEQLLHVRAALCRPTHQYRTGAVFVDYAKAFDTVDYDKIAREMHRMKVSPHIVKWCVSFLSNRTVRVRFKEKLFRSRTFERGVPQGTVLGPIMFIIVMNSLSQRLAEVPLLQHGFFADDLTLLARHTERDVINHTLQCGLNVVLQWSKEYFMSVNVAKTKWTLFGCTERHPLTLQLDGERIGADRTPKLLGVTFQCLQGMATHAAETRRKMDFRLLQIAAISASTWGPRRQVLRAFYLALVQAHTMYGIEVWYWDASERSRDLLAAAQHKASRIIAGIPHGTRKEDSLLEANLLPLKTTTLVCSMKFMLMCESRDGCLRRSAEEVYHSKHPVRALHSRIMLSYPHLHIEPREHPLETSTLRHSCRPIFHTQIKPVCTDDPDDLKREASEKWIERNFARRGKEPPRREHYELWTDGSVSLGEKSGAGALLYRNNTLICAPKTGAGELSCSYRAECVALKIGLQRLLKWLPAYRSTPSRLSIFSDSLSMLTALQTGPLAVTDPILRRLWRLLLQVQRRKVRIRLQFVFGHCGVKRNEVCDDMAKKAADLPQLRDTWIIDIIAYAKRVLRSEEVHENTHRFGITANHFPTKHKEELTREEETALARFRVGSSRHYGWMFRKINPSVPPQCRWCNPQHAAIGPTIQTAPPVATRTLQRTSEPTKCTECDATYQCRSSAVTHMVNKHGFVRADALRRVKYGDATPIVDIPREPPPVVAIVPLPSSTRVPMRPQVLHCTLCASKFAVPGRLLHHLRTIHGIGSGSCRVKRGRENEDSLQGDGSAPAAPAPQDTRKLPFQCDLCETSFGTRSSLSIHKKFKHKSIVTEDGTVVVVVQFPRKRAREGNVDVPGKGEV